MKSGDDEFVRLAGAVLGRFFVQNGKTPPSEAERVALAARLWALVEARGLPRALSQAERGEPGEMSDAECPLWSRT